MTSANPTNPNPGPKEVTQGKRKTSGEVQGNGKPAPDKGTTVKVGSKKNIKKLTR